MATEQKSGFRLPWSTDGDKVDEEQRPFDADGDASTGVEGVHDEVIEVIEASSGDDSAAATPDETVTEPATDEADAAEADAPDATPAPRTRSSAAPARISGSSRFRAELTRAMQTAAEQARGDALERFSADAKAEVEAVHAASATEAEALAKSSDRDVAEIRDWSKTEIARIREEAETRTTARKAALEAELEEHAARIERRIDKVQAAIGAYEAEMAEFFEALLAEEDPSRFAAMAESLPEPPPFDLDDAADAAAADEATAESIETLEAEPTPDAGPEVTVDPDLADNAVESTENQSDAAPIETPRSNHGWPSEELDPRVTAMGLTSDAAAEAEAEAESFADLTDDSDVEIPVLTDDALAARLAGLVPADERNAAAVVASQDSRVVVVGLVSVAAIAGFKRHVSRIPGVSAVGVTSGPNGEFIFAVTHAADIHLQDAIPNLPGFAARVTGVDGSTIDVSAHDPEADA